MNPFEIVCTFTKDRAEADTPEAALLAARTLAQDAQDASGTHGTLKAARASLYVTENGVYSGVLTTFAREGVTV